MTPAAGPSTSRRVSATRQCIAVSGFVSGRADRLGFSSSNSRDKDATRWLFLTQCLDDEPPPSGQDLQPRRSAPARGRGEHRRNVLAMVSGLTSGA